MNSIFWLLNTMSQRSMQLLRNAVNVLSQGTQTAQSSPLTMAATTTLALFGIIYVAPRVNTYLRGRMEPVAAGAGQERVGATSAGRRVDCNLRGRMEPVAAGAGQERVGATSSGRTPVFTTTISPEPSNTANSSSSSSSSNSV